MATPEQVLAFATQEAERLGVPADLVRNTVMAESGGNISARSTKGAIGPMQLMPETAKDLGVDPRNWQQNVSGGIQYLGKMLNRFGSPELAAAAYNAGPGNVDKYGGIPPFKETQDYVKKVVKMEQSKDEDFIPFGSSKSQLAAAPSNEDFIPFKGNVTSQQQPQSFAGDVKAGVVQAVKGGTPTAQAITSALDIISNLAYKGATALGVPKSVLGPNSAQAELERRAQEASAQPTRTIGQTFSDLGTLATNRPGLLLGSLAVPDPTSLFLPAKIAGATEKALTTAGTAARTAERSGQVAGAAGTGVAQAALSQVGAPNADQFGTDVGMSLITAPLAAIGGARTPQTGKPLTQKELIAQRAIDQGITLPPSQVSPDSAILRTIEGVSGPNKIAQLASLKNQEIVNQKARQALGLPENTPITEATLLAYRQEQGNKYDVAKSQNYYADGKFMNSVNDEINRLGKLKGVDVSEEIATLQGIKQLNFDGESLVEIVKRLKEDANSNMMPTANAATRQLGRAQKFAVSQLEDMMERTLQRTKGNSDILDQFKQARENIAKSYTIQKATNLATGDVSASALGSRVASGKIVPAELRDIANAASPSAFPLAFQNVGRIQSPQALNMTDVVTGIGTAAATGQPLAAAAATARPAGRSLLTSEMVQRMIRPQSPVAGPIKPSARPVVMPYLATTPFQPVTRGLLDYMNQ